MSQNSPQKWFNLEEQFYKGVDQQLLHRMREEMDVAESAEAIMRVAGIQDADVAKAMAEMKITVDTLAAFRLAPVVAVAWADDRVEDSERQVVLQAAKESGIAEDDAAMEVLKSWTTHRPGDELLDAWCEYVAALKQSLSEPHRAALKQEVLKLVQAVAQAAGGILGFGSVSPNEKKTMERIEQALG